MDMLNQFGKEFIQEVRDRSFRKYFKTKAGEMRAEKDKELHKQLSKFDEEQIKVVDDIVLDMLEFMLHQNLFFFENTSNWAITLKDELSKTSLIDLAEESDGLSGELYSEDGWISNYSEYPYNE